MTNEKMNKPIEKRDCHVCHHKYPDMIYCSACGPRCNSCYINRELHIKALEDEMGFLCDKNMEYHNRVIELEDDNSALAKGLYDRNEDIRNFVKKNKALMELLKMADHRIGMEVCDCVEDRVCLRCQWLRKHKEIKNGQRDPI